MVLGEPLLTETRTFAPGSSQPALPGGWVAVSTPAAVVAVPAIATEGLARVSAAATTAMLRRRFLDMQVIVAGGACQSVAKRDGPMDGRLAEWLGFRSRGDRGW